MKQNTPDQGDVKLGLNINQALVEKDGSKLIEAVVMYMEHFDLHADVEIIERIPRKLH